MSIHDDHANGAADGTGAVEPRAREPEPRGEPGMRRRAVTHEALGWAFALAMAALVTAHIAITRTELMFIDADSMLSALLTHSAASGAPQDWAMSPVLFVPEAIAFGAVSTVVPDLRTAFIVSSMLNFVALYGAFRVAAGSRRTATAPVLGAVTAYAGFCAIVLLESGGDRNSMQLASLLGTTTYYSATVVASVLVIGLARRALDDGRLRAGVWAPLTAIVAVSAFSNPLIVVWAVAPAALVLLVLTITSGRSGRSGRRRGRMPRRPSVPLLVLLVLAGASAIGIVARSAVGDVIVAQGPDYVKHGNQLTALTELLRVAAVELARPGGIIAAILLLGLTALALTLTISRTVADRPGTAVLVAVAWIAPVACTIGLIMLGNPSPRYLQPWVFAPVLVLACLAEWLPARPRRSPAGGGGPGRRRGTVPALAAASVVIVVLGSLGVMRLATATPAPTPTTTAGSLACVVDWVNATDRHGAGQFWTVRAPKAYADDPAQLLQVTHDLHPYAWLVNRTDFEATSVSFLITDAQSAPFDLPGERQIEDAATVDCGRYTIHDFWPTEIHVR